MKKKIVWSLALLLCPMVAVGENLADFNLEVETMSQAQALKQELEGRWMFIHASIGEPIFVVKLSNAHLSAGEVAFRQVVIAVCRIENERAVRVEFPKSGSTIKFNSEGAAACAEALELLNSNQSIHQELLQDVQ